MKLRAASVQLQGGPPRNRRRASVVHYDEFVAVIEAADSPPSWFDVPATDLQPTLLATIEGALVGAFATRSPERMLEAANRELHSLAAKDPYKGSCAEAVIAMITGSSVRIAWVGTARAYAGARLVTRDHSLLEDYIAAERQAGRELSADEIAAFPHKGIITRALGSHAAVAADVVEVALVPGERLVLASPQVPAPSAVGGTLDEAALALATAGARAAPRQSIAVAVVEVA